MAEQHVRWDEFDKIHVIRKLREIVGKWWKIQLNFTDQKGLLRGVPDGKFFNPLNHICNAITSNPKGFEGCRGTARTTTASMTTSSLLTHSLTGVTQKKKKMSSHSSPSIDQKTLKPPWYSSRGG